VRIFLQCFAFSLWVCSLNATPAPNFTITTSDGVSRNLYADYVNQQKLVVIEAFFTTCPPCNAHAADWQALYQSMQAAYPGKVEFIMLSTQSFDKNTNVATYKTTKGLTMLGAGENGGSLTALEPYTTGQFGDFLGTHPDTAPVIVVAMALLLGAFCGLLNGILVAYGRVPSIIVTLGTLALFRTFLVEYSDARTITTESLPKWLVDLPQQTLISVGGFDLKIIVALALVAAAIFWLVLTRIRAARKFYAVGSNPDAAMFAGINAARVVLTAFVLSGMMAGLGGFIFLAKFGNITVVAGLGFELKSVAAVVVGGVNIFGGSGSIIGVVLGSVLVDVIDNSLIRWAIISEFWREALLGLLIMAAVAADTFMTRGLGRLKGRGE
jgi:rhamnose transport system permease protein